MQDATHGTVKSGNLVDTSTQLTGRHWSNCEDQARLLEDLVNIGLDITMPIKYSKLHVNEPPWFTPEFKSLISDARKRLHLEIRR